MTTSKRVSSKQKLDSILEGFERVVDVQNKHNQKIGELLNSIVLLNKKMDSMVELLRKAGEIPVDKEGSKEKESGDRELTFSDL